MGPDRKDDLGKFDYCSISGRYSVYILCHRQLGLDMAPCVGLVLQNPNLIVFVALPSVACQGPLQAPLPLLAFCLEWLLMD